MWKKIDIMHEDFSHGKKTKAEMKNWTDALSITKRVENSAKEIKRYSMTRDKTFHKGLDPEGKIKYKKILATKRVSFSSKKMDILLLVSTL